MGARRRQLDGQRQAVQPLANLRYGRGIVSVQGKSRMDSPGPFDKQARPVELQQIFQMDRF